MQLALRRHADLDELSLHDDREQRRQKLKEAQRYLGDVISVQAGSLHDAGYRLERSVLLTDYPGSTQQVPSVTSPRLCKTRLRIVSGWKPSDQKLQYALISERLRDEK